MTAPRWNDQFSLDLSDLRIELRYMYSSDSCDRVSRSGYTISSPQSSSAPHVYHNLSIFVYVYPKSTKFNISTRDGTLLASKGRNCNYLICVADNERLRVLLPFDPNFFPICATRDNVVLMRIKRATVAIAIRDLS